MIPVVAGAPVPRIRLAYGVQAGLTAGTAALVLGLLGDVALISWAVGILAATFLLFLGPTLFALLRAPAPSDTTTGMRLAVFGLVAVILLGAGLALARLALVRVDLGRWLIAHVALGLTVWIGGLIASVSWQVVPMFYLTAPYPRWSRLATLVALALSLAGVPLAALAGATFPLLLATAAPAAVAVWLLHPAMTALLIARRKRKKVGESVHFWWAGLALAPLCLGSAAAAWWLDPRYAVLFGWLTLFGWAGLIVHGMLTRIVPFLVWFHRFAPLAGLQPIPSMRQLLPDERARVGLLLHGATGLAGAAAILTASSLLARATALGLIATGLWLGFVLASVAKRRP